MCLTVCDAECVSLKNRRNSLMQIKSSSNGKVAFWQVFATDLDSGLNGLIEYSVLSGNQGEAFHIDALSGVITADGILDYEFISSYRFVSDADPFG